MKRSVNNLSKSKVELTITLGAEELEAAEQVALKKLSKTIKVAGFRKGHVPLNVVAKNVDSNALQQEVVENALSKAVAESFMAENLQALERPEVEVKSFVPKQTLEFVATAEVLPPVKLGDYKKLNVEAKKVTVSKKDVDEVVERIRTSLAEKKPVKRAAKDGDEAVIDFVGKMDGKAFDGGTGNDYPLVLGSDSFIPGFEAGVVGHKIGDKFEVPVTFPDDYHAETLKGKKAIFDVEIKQLNETDKPELTDELAAKAGPFTSVDELLKDIKRELTAQKERELDAEAKEDLVTQLIEKSEVEAPEVLVEDQIKSIEQDLTQNLMYSGMTIEQYYKSKDMKDRDDWVKKEARAAAEKRILGSMVLAELSKELKVEADSEELAEFINTYRTRYANNPEMAKKFEEPEIQRELANRLLTEKTIDKLLEINKK